MPTVTLRSASGAEKGTVELAADLFGVQPNVPVMHQVVTAQLAKRRAGTQSTKTRAEVSGGGKKPFKQKGTGNARQGSTRAPHWSGGGVALGPKPRKYDQKTPKKMIRLALASALSDRAAAGKVVVLDEWGFDTPKTKTAIAALEALGVSGRVLVVVSRDDEAAAKSFRNLPHVQLIEPAELNAYDVLCNEWVVFTSATLPSGSPEAAARLAAKAGAAPAAAPEAAPAAHEPEAPTGDVVTEAALAADELAEPEAAEAETEVLDADAPVAIAAAVEETEPVAEVSPDALADAQGGDDEYLVTEVPPADAALANETDTDEEPS